MSDVFPKDGVTAEYLCNEFIEDLGGIPLLQGLTTAQVIQDKIKPITLLWKSSYCTYLRLRNHPACHPTAQVFISHGHSYIFLDLINAISWVLRKEPQTIVWIDFCAINQHAPMDWTFEWLSTTFKLAIQGMGRTIMVMSPWNDPLPFKRSWCVFEAYCTAEKENCKFEIALSKTDEEQFLKDMIGNGQRKITEVLCTICSEKSECCSESDKAAIFNVIQSSVGFSKLDSMVFESYRGWVLEVALKRLNDVHYCSRSSTASAPTTTGGGGGGEDKKNYCNLLQVVADIYYSQGNYIKAESYYREAFGCANKDLSSFHKSNNPHYVLRIMNDLAVALNGQGKHKEAQEMYRKCLKLQSSKKAKLKLVLGENDYHKYILTTMSNLAGVLYRQGKIQKAEKMYRKCLSQRMDILGKDHPSTLGSMNNLAGVLEDLKKYDEAEELYRDCLEQQRRILGDDHPDTLTTMNNLALLLLVNHQQQQQQDKQYEKEAEKLLRTCLHQRMAKFGKEHPETLNSMNNLAGVLYEQGKYQEAEELYRACLEQQRQQQQKQQQQQQPMSIQIGENENGKHTPDVSILKSMKKLSYALYCQGGKNKSNEAEELLRTCFEQQISIFGNDHPDTLDTMSELISLLKEQGKDTSIIKELIMTTTTTTTATTSSSTTTTAAAAATTTTTTTTTTIGESQQTPQSNKGYTENKRKMTTTMTRTILGWMGMRRKNRTNEKGL